MQKQPLSNIFLGRTYIRLTSSGKANELCDFCIKCTKMPDKDFQHINQPARITSVIRSSTLTLELKQHIFPRKSLITRTEANQNTCKPDFHCKSIIQLLMCFCFVSQMEERVTIIVFGNRQHLHDNSAKADCVKDNKAD